MKVGDRVRDRLFYLDSEFNRGTGTITEIHPIEEDPKGLSYAVIRWDKPIPDGNPFALTDDTSEDYLEDVELLESTDKVLREAISIDME
jgi:hypothetical protein